MAQSWCAPLLHFCCTRSAVRDSSGEKVSEGTLTFMNVKRQVAYVLQTPSTSLTDSREGMIGKHDAVAATGGTQPSNFQVLYSSRG